MIDRRLEALRVGRGQKRHVQLRLFARHARELGAESEEVHLNVREDGRRVRIGLRGAGDADRRVQLVDRAVRFDARRRLRRDLRRIARLCHRRPSSCRSSSAAASKYSPSLSAAIGARRRSRAPPCSPPGVVESPDVWPSMSSAGRVPSGKAFLQAARASPSASTSRSLEDVAVVEEPGARATRALGGRGARVERDLREVRRALEGGLGGGRCGRAGRIGGYRGRFERGEGRGARWNIGRGRAQDGDRRGRSSVEWIPEHPRRRPARPRPPPRSSARWTARREGPPPPRRPLVAAAPNALPVRGRRKAVTRAAHLAQALFSS